MKKIWSEATATNFLSKAGVTINGKSIVIIKGLGLTSCSARDYLVNYCGYK